MPSTFYQGKRFVQTVHEIYCRHCKTKIRSESQHDFKMCPCGKVGIDGGITPGNRILGHQEDFVDLGRWRTETRPFQWIEGAELQQFWRLLREERAGKKVAAEITASKQSPNKNAVV